MKFFFFLSSGARGSIFFNQRSKTHPFGNLPRDTVGSRKFKLGKRGALGCDGGLMDFPPNDDALLDMDGSSSCLVP